MKADSNTSVQLCIKKRSLCGVFRGWLKFSWGRDQKHHLSFRCGVHRFDYIAPLNKTLTITRYFVTALKHNYKRQCFSWKIQMWCLCNRPTLLLMKSSSSEKATFTRGLWVLSYIQRCCCSCCSDQRHFKIILQAFKMNSVLCTSEWKN